MECTRRSPLFRRYQCAQEHPLFYALTALFPSISQYKRKMETRAKGGDFSDDPSSADISRTGAPRKLVFTPSPAPLPKAVNTFDSSHQGLRPFTAALLVILALSPPGSRNQLPHSPSQSNTCHWHLRRPYCRQQDLPARLTIKPSFSLELPLPARF